MKKILLSVIALFAAVSMNAQTAVNDDPSYFNLDKSSGWGGKWFDLKDADGNLNYDASAYEYAWIKFSGNTGKFRFGLTYSEWKSTEAWGETYFDAMNVIEDAEGISFIKLEKEKTYEFGGPDKAASPYAGDTWDKHLRQIWTQDDGTEVSVTIEGIWFGTAAELKAALGGGSSEGGSEGGEETIEGLGTAFNVENNLGLDSENGTALAAGTELASNEFVTITTGADDTYKPQEVAFKINGGDVFKGGLQGGTNPKDADGASPNTSLSAPVSGAFLAIEAKEDGFLYIIHKASSNKAYTVFEEGTAIGYKFAAQGDAATDLGAVYQFELEGEGELNEIVLPIDWAEQEFLEAYARREELERLDNEIRTLTQSIEASTQMSINDLNTFFDDEEGSLQKEDLDTGEMDRRVGEIETEMKNIMEDGEIDDLMQKRANSENALKDQLREWAVYSIANSIILDA